MESRCVLWDSQGKSSPIFEPPFLISKVVFKRPIMAAMEGEMAWA